jgi:hypothetical protein
MTDTSTKSAAVPAKVSPAEVATNDPRKLDDVLLAMDVVDTLRHRERLVDQELNAQAREEQLIARLKEIYGAQGIEVPDKILKDGVKALDEQRFVYKPPENSFSVKLAKLYVSRKRWLPAATTFTAAVIALVAGWQIFWAIPQASEWNKMPGEIAQLLKQGQDLATEPVVDAELASVAAEGQRDVASNDHAGARTQVATLKDMNEKLQQDYDVRIVSRPGRATGIWRHSVKNPGEKNYYIIVEAVAPGGRVLTLPVANEETDTTERVTVWAQRVMKDTWDKIAAEKQASGVIMNDTLGHKERGKLEPTWDAPTPKGAITKWDE